MGLSNTHHQMLCSPHFWAEWQYDKQITKIIWQHSNRIKTRIWSCLKSNFHFRFYWMSGSFLMAHKHGFIDSTTEYERWNPCCLIYPLAAYAEICANPQKCTVTIKPENCQNRNSHVSKIRHLPVLLYLSRNTRCQTNSQYSQCMLNFVQLRKK